MPRTMQSQTTVVKTAREGSFKVIGRRGRCRGMPTVSARTSDALYGHGGARSRRMMTSTARHYMDVGDRDAAVRRTPAQRFLK